MTKKKIFNVLKVLLILYCAIGLAIYYLQEKFLLHPEKLAADHKFSFTGKFSELRIPFNEEDTMSLVKFFPADTARGVVLYFHGNKRNVERYAPFAAPFLKNGYEVWMPDYPGFGKSTGRISEEKLLHWASQARDMAGAAFGADSIVVYGKSLGSALAAYSVKPGDKLLILETPYYSITDLFNNYAWMYPLKTMLRYELPTHRFLNNPHPRAVLMHGTADRVIPYSNAEKLRPVLSARDRFITIAGASHNDLNRRPEYLSMIDSLLR